MQWDPITQDWYTPRESPQARGARLRAENLAAMRVAHANTPEGRLEARRKYERERKARYRARRQAK